MNIEDADNISKKDLVIFCDASTEEGPGYKLQKLEPDATVDLPCTMFLRHTYFTCAMKFTNVCPNVTCFISRVRMGVLSEMTLKAKSNLDAAYDYITHFLTEY
ncbi:MAG: hypothetical protein HC906_03040, partial [Bacteroidales bacterium]|nr:hypothetical protein [Bacteroidales bacterium]